MKGLVQANHALLDVTFALTGQPHLTITFVVDTGFAGYLTLPAQAVAALSLPFLRRVKANLADDSAIHASVHLAVILWNGEQREVDVIATGSRPLLGTLLLDGCELIVQFAEGGLVAVEPL
jgi:clan AA aspartic protease